MNIVIADDRPTNLKVLRVMLQAVGHAVFEAADGLETLKILKRERIDAVISDILMPNMDGFQLCFEIRRSPQFNRVPVILYSGTHLSPTDRKMAVDFGANAFLEKPATAEKLAATIRDVVSGAVPRPAVGYAEDMNVLQHYSERLVKTIEEKYIQLSQKSDALKESEEKFRQMADSIPEVFWMTVPGMTKVLYVSSAYETIWGRPRREVYDDPRSWLAGVHPEDRGRVAEDFDQEKYRAGPFDQEFRIVRPDGAVRWIHNRAFPVRDASGEIYRVTGIAQDVTDRKLVEEAILEKERRFFSLAQSVRDALVTADDQGVVIFWNVAAEGIFGYTEAEIVGQPLTVLMPEKYRPLHLAGLDHYLRTGQSHVIGKTVELEGLTKDGRVFPIELSLGSWTAGGHTYFSAILRDLTSRKAAEEALRHSAEQLRQAQKMEAVGRLAGGVAHDFNNLLTVIGGYSQMLLTRLPGGDPTRDAVEEIRKAGERAVGLTRQLLAFSRKQVLQSKLMDLNEVVLGAQKMLQRLIGEDVDLAFLPARQPARIKADPGQIEQIIMNLAVNARDAMPTGGKLTIETRLVTLDEAYARDHADARPGRYAKLMVTDTGCGMDSHALQHLFEPFFTTKEPGKGTGLGLATVYGIVRQSGGHIGVYSEPGHGTVFKVYLPAAEGAEPLPAGGAAPETAPRGAETILVVEDEPAIRGLIEASLRDCGYTVLTAGDGEEAVRVAAEHAGSIDLVVTDVVMPRLAGRELVERLGKTRPRLRVIFISGYTDDAVVRHGILESDVAFLQKPFTPQTLARKIREVLDGPRPGGG